MEDPARVDMWPACGRLKVEPVVAFCEKNCDHYYFFGRKLILLLKFMWPASILYLRIWPASAKRFSTSIIKNKKIF